MSSVILHADMGPLEIEGVTSKDDVRRFRHDADLAAAVEAGDDEAFAERFSELFPLVKEYDIPETGSLRVAVIGSGVRYGIFIQDDSETLFTEHDLTEST